MEEYKVEAIRNGKVIAQTKTPEEGIPLVIRNFFELISDEEKNDKSVSFSVLVTEII